MTDLPANCWSIYFAERNLKFGEIFMRKCLSLLVILISSFANASQNYKSSASFYGRPAAWIFDLIQSSTVIKPTAVRRASIIDNGQTVGFIQFGFPGLECTAHGKTSALPSSSEDSQLILCAVSAPQVKSIFTNDSINGGSLSFNDSAAETLFKLLAKVEYTEHIDQIAGDPMGPRQQTQKSFGQQGVDGISCTEVALDDQSQPKIYACGLSWEANPTATPMSVQIGN